MKGLFVKTREGMAPVDDAAREALGGAPVGALLFARVNRPRNPRHHALFWKLCSHIAEAVGCHRESVAAVIKLRTDHVITVQTATGIERYPKSISFSSMGQDEFNTFFNRAVQVVCEGFLPHIKPGKLRTEIEQMLDIPQAQTEAA
jgi:hypothetical protein